MANITYIQFEETLKSCIDYWEMDGKITKHIDYGNYLIGIVFRFKHRYLSVNDIINFDPLIDREIIFNGTIKHLEKIKDQFNYYFNAIWC